MINTHAFDYINVLDKAADASWLRNEAISNNISNAQTPGYKRQDVAFESELRKALRSSRYESVDSKVANLKVSDLEARPYTDNSGYSYRLDGNNVDPDTEGVYLAENQVYYQGLIDSIRNQFSNLKLVMK